MKKTFAAAAVILMLVSALFGCAALGTSGPDGSDDVSAAIPDASETPSVSPVSSK